MTAQGLAGLTELEAAIDRPIGGEPSSAPLPRVSRDLHPVRALENAIRPALERPPCLIAFSGGRDSSVLLGVATHVARRDGLPLPIPATYRFPELPETDESGWQEAVVRRLGLEEWHRRAFRDELDMLGPIARGVLARHGPLSPSNAFFFVPLFSDAAGGAVITGHEGDGLFGGGRAVRARSALGGLVSPTANDIVRIAAALAPRPVRRLRLRHRREFDLAWLRPSPQRAIRNQLANEVAGEPLFWNARVQWWARQRYLSQLRSTLDLLAGDAGTHFFAPLLNPVFLAAMARRGGRTGFGNRTSLIRALFGAFIPEALIARSDKAYFTRAHWHLQTRNFARQWDCSGLPRHLIEADVLKRTWTETEPDVRSGLLLHQAWLAHSGHEVTKQPDRPLD
jgi:asparagine synthase (glutamine-hydrolysing)